MTSSRRFTLIESELTASVIGGFYRVRNELGIGFVESVYAAALSRELTLRGHAVAREVVTPIFYRDEAVAHQRLDMVVDGKLLLELKSTEQLHRDATRQLFNYLCATRLEVGLLLHFCRQPKFYRFVCENDGKRSRMKE